MAEIRSGLNLDNLDEMTDEERTAHLTHHWRDRGSLYVMYSASLMADYAPTFAKLHSRGVAATGQTHDEEDSQSKLVIWGCTNLSTYIFQGWETGIFNEFNALRKNGLGKDQVMEVVMFTQLYAGMRGLGHVYRAVGDFLPAWGSPSIAPVFPKGWVPDPEAFKSGLDLSVREMTSADRANLEAWYEKNIGYVPSSMLFGLKYHPEFTKVNRAKWEVAIRTLPKQIAPYLMLRHNLITQNKEGLREATLLCRSWGVRKSQIVAALNAVVYYFAGSEGWYAPAAAIDDILESME
jgi:hypothetical protein